jgi:hypothetical protein
MRSQWRPWSAPSLTAFAMLQAAFRGGVDRFVALTGESLEAVGAEHGHDRAVLMFAAMVGGLALSRAIRDVNVSGSADTDSR